MLETILAPLFKMLEAIFELLVPLVVASLIDVGIQQKNTQHIWEMCIFLVIFAFIGFLVSITAQYFSAKAAMGVGTTLRSQIFRKIQYMSFAQLDNVGNATLVNYIISDINMVQTGVNIFLRLFLRSPFIVIGATIMAFRIDTTITFIFIIATLLIIAVIMLILKTTIIAYKKAQERLDSLALLIRENHTGARLVRAFDRQVDEEREFEEHNQTYTKLQIWAGRISALMNPITFVVMNAAIIFILYVAAPGVNQGRFTQGEVVALINYLIQILLAIGALAHLVMMVTKAIASMLRLEGILNMPIKEDVRESKDEQIALQEEQNIITFDKVSFQYEGASKTQLEDLTFSLPKGSRVGIIGGTGAGKSTLINLLPRFYDVSAGRICIKGVDVQEISTKKLRDSIAIVPQYATLCKGTLRDNLNWGNEFATDEEMLKALQVAQASAVLEDNAQGLDMKIEQGGSNLSGGQRQRVSIARALVKNAEILILDDSDSALDYRTEAKLRQELHKYTQDKTVLIVSQRVRSIQDADVILVLDDGRLVGKGTHETLLKENKVYCEIYESQIESGDKRGAKS